MTEAELFDPVAQRLEEATSLDRLEARGTLRIALKQAGFEPSMVRPDEFRVVVERVLPKELSERGVADPAVVCGELASYIDSLSETIAARSPESPEDVFRRLGGS